MLHACCCSKAANNAAIALMQGPSESCGGGGGIPSVSVNTHAFCCAELVKHGGERDGVGRLCEKRGVRCDAFDFYQQVPVTRAQLLQAGALLNEVCTHLRSTQNA